MRQILTIVASVVLFTFPALADEWDGQLVDANCTNQRGGASACDPSSDTTAFGLVMAGKAYLFDSKGNHKAAEAMKDRAERSAASNEKLPTHVNATVMGEGRGKTILVKSIDLD
jgi:hypothetical protein